MFCDVCSLRYVYYIAVRPKSYSNLVNRGTHILGVLPIDTVAVSVVADVSPLLG